LRAYIDSVLKKSLIRYMAIGIFTTIFYILLIFLCIKYGFSRRYSSIFSHFIIGIIAFFLNHSWTFKARRDWHSYIKKYCSILFLTLAFNYFVMTIFGSSSSSLYFFGLFLICFFIPLLNYLLHKYWTFID
jgi:putative flippase GtrA